jgi:hypothetical protein
MEGLNLVDFVNYYHELILDRITQPECWYVFITCKSMLRLDFLNAMDRNSGMYNSIVPKMNSWIPPGCTSKCNLVLLINHAQKEYICLPPAWMFWSLRELCSEGRWDNQDTVAVQPYTGPIAVEMYKIADFNFVIIECCKQSEICTSDLDVQNLSQYSTNKLREVCKIYGSDVNGTRAELEERIRSIHRE